MTSTSQPPRLARRLLRWALPQDRRADIVGDLDEVFGRRSREQGLGRARRWYWREVVIFSGRFLAERLRERWSRRTSSEQRNRSGVPRVGRPSLGFSMLDLKLGVRMLLKYPGLTLVGTLAMSIAIATVAGFHAFTEHFVGPNLPVPEGDRVVGIWNVDGGGGGRGRQTVGDMLTWRRELESLEDLGTFTTGQRVIFSADGGARSVRAARISPSAFRMLRVAPFLGRPLVDDERPGGPAVALIAFDLWQAEFGADPAIVGKTIRMGGVPHAIVGVMPSGFAFPVNEQLWTPFRIPSSNLGPGTGPEIRFTIGRLAPGVTLGEAEAELQGVGSRLAAGYPETHQRLRPQIDAYARSFMAADDPTTVNMLRVLRILIVVVLIIAAVNVATLVYARTAARVGEISVRKALGASRRRIAVQLFAEALVLASLAGALGIGIAMWALKRVVTILNLSLEGIPYWWDAGMGSATLLLVVGLVLLSAVLTGVLPALAITGRRVGSSLQRTGAGDSGLSFGKAASAIVVIQVAISLGSLTLGGTLMGPFIEDYAMDDGIAREQYLSAEVRLDREPSSSDLGDARAAEFARNAEIWRELGRRVSREPGVLGVTFATSLPGVEHPVHFYQLEGAPLPSERGYSNRSRVAWVEPGYFGVFGVPMRVGRAFNAGDVTGSEARVAIVNEKFARGVLGFGEPIGQRIQLDPLDDGGSGQWAEIVGVVPDLTVDMGSNAGDWPAIYFPLVSTARAIHMAVHLGEDPSLFTGRLRAIGGGIDPSLVLHRPRTLDEIVGAPVKLMHLFGLGLGLLVLAALVLSTAGVYSLMSFTVSQRTREIGIRIALGAHPRRVVSDVFSRAILQLLLGTALGLTPLMGPGDLLFQYGPWAAIGIAGIMLIMGLAACGKPVSRALRIQPTEALREGR